MFSAVAVVVVVFFLKENGDRESVYSIHVQFYVILKLFHIMSRKFLTGHINTLNIKYICIYIFILTDDDDLCSQRPGIHWNKGPQIFEG